MVKKQSENNDLETLYTLLYEFMENETPLDIALDILKSYEPSNLALLLEKYYGGSLVFESLIEDDNLKNIVIYFCEINPKIITMPFRDTSIDERSNLLGLILEQPNEYSDILAWVQKYKPDIIEADKARAIEIGILQRTLVTHIEKQNLTEFQALLTKLSKDELLNALTFDGNYDVINAALFSSTDLSYITFLISLNKSILKIDMTGQTVFDCLRDKPKIYASVLEFISQKYPKALSKTKRAKQHGVQMHHDGFFSPKGPMVANTSETEPNEAIFKEALMKPPPPLLTSSQIDAFSASAFTEFDEKRMPFVNTHLLIDNSILDAFLYQTFRGKLAKKRIALMPTIRNCEPIAIEQLVNARSGVSLLYTTGVGIENQMITPILEEQKITLGFDFAVWPIYLMNKHYGLLILALSDSPGLATSHGFYIEPLNESLMFRMIYASMDAESQAKFTPPIDPEQIKKVLRTSMYENYVQRLTLNLQMSEENFGYSFLSQDFNENYCSDYVIAVIALMASGDIDLTNVQESLFSLNKRRLSEEAVRRIRMLEIKMVGMDYFRLQLPAPLQKLAVGMSIDELVQFHHNSEPAVMEQDKSSDTHIPCAITETTATTERGSASWCSMFPKTDPTEASDSSITPVTSSMPTNVLSPGNT